MDVFCYRFTGKYNHLDFCKTLHTVLSSVIGVIWLPRSKLRFSQGQYPYFHTVLDGVLGYLYNHTDPDGVLGCP